MLCMDSASIEVCLLGGLGFVSVGGGCEEDGGAGVMKRPSGPTVYNNAKSLYIIMKTTNTKTTEIDHNTR